MKVVVVCSFSNMKVREHLPLSKRRIYSFVRRLLGLTVKSEVYGDVAGWDTYLIELLRRRNDIELTVISAHSGLLRRIVSFVLDGVHYHFLRVEGATLLKYLISSPSLWHKFNPLRPVVKRIVKNVNPDLMALIGAENAHISGTVIGINNIPLIVKCQTIYNNPDREKSASFDVKNAYVERLLFRDLQYVSVGAGMHCRLFRQFNNSAFNLKWPLGYLLPDVKLLEKEFDFVNFAMTMIPKKGFPDAVRALTIVKNLYPRVKLNLVGGGSREVIEYMKRLVNELQLEKNVVFTPFFERQDDLFQHIQKSRFAVLPCKLDSVASTIRQAMHYELPVICYKTEGTPKLNQDNECVLIAENGDVEELASKMIQLLSDKQLGDTLRHNAKLFSRRWNDDDSTLRQMVDDFYAVVDNYRNGTPIPKNLLYDECHGEK